MVLLFYDGPEKPAIFDGFDGFPTILDNIGEKSFRRFMDSFPVNLALNMRGAFATFSTTLITPRFLEAVRAEAAVRHL